MKYFLSTVTIGLAGIRCEGEDWQKLGQLSSIDILNSHICEVHVCSLLLCFLAAKFVIHEVLTTHHSSLNCMIQSILNRLTLNRIQLVFALLTPQWHLFSLTFFLCRQEADGVHSPILAKVSTLKQVFRPFLLLNLSLLEMHNYCNLCTPNFAMCV